MEEPQQSVPEADLVDSTGQPILQQSVVDALINAEVFLPHGDDLLVAKVLWRAIDSKGKVIGFPDTNLLVNTLQYDVEFPDGNIKKYTEKY